MKSSEIQTSLKYDIDEAEKMLQNVAEYVRSYMVKNTNLPYHNFEHAYDVAGDALDLGLVEQIEDHELFLVQTAGLVHDLIVQQANANSYIEAEEATATNVEKILPSFGYSVDDTKQIANLVRATNLMRTPESKLEKIMRDADVGKKSMYKLNKLRIELGHITDKNWYEWEIDWFEKHNWFTDGAKKLWDDKKQYLIQHLKMDYSMLPK